jgi:CXXC-20-CXXC protein
LQHCKNCHTQFKWKKVYQYLWGPIIKPLCCHTCDQEHSLTIKGRFTNSMLTIFPMLVFMQFLSPFQNILLTGGIGFLLGIIGSLLGPYLVGFKLDDNNQSNMI